VSVLRKLFWFLVILPPAVVLIALAVSNRHMVRLVLDPLSPADQALAIETPLFLLLFAALLLGLLLGGFATWLGQGKWRKRARSEKREAAQRQKEANRLNELMEASAPPRLEQAPPAD
jgi:uncharacterized integral membrane protein